MPGQQKAPRFAKLPQSIALRYGIGLSVFLLSSLLRAAVSPWLSSDHGFVFFLPGIILVTFFAGLGSAILTTVLSGLVLWYVFVPPTYSFEITNLGDAIGLVAFVLASGAGIALIHWLRVTLLELHAAREQAEALAGQREAVIDRTPFMLCRLGRDMRYRFISKAYAKMIGRPPEEIVGRHIADILRPQGFNAVRPYIETVLRGESTEYELEIDLPVVGRRLLRGIYTPERDARGNVDGWIASIVDIGEQKRTELLRRQLADIVDSSDDAIISEDLDGVIVTWNPGAQRLFGYSANEVVGRSTTVLIPPQLEEEEPQLLARIQRGEHIHHYETVRRRKDGGTIYVSLSMSPMRNAAGAIIGASKIAHDITSRRYAEMALARHADEQLALYEFTDRLYRTDSLAVVYDAALDAILAALRCSRASIQRFDEHGVMRFVAWRGLSDTYRQVVENQSPWPREERNPEPVCVDDAAGARFSKKIKKMVAQEGIGALAFIPMMVHGELAGKFMAYYEAPHAFSKDETDVALNIARQLGFAIERMQAQEARRVAEAELRHLSEMLASEVERRILERDRIWNVSEDLLGVSNFDGYFVSINPAWTKLLGWSEDEIKSMHVSALRHPDDAAHSMAGRAQLARGVSPVRMENRFRHRDGSWRWIHWTMSADKGLIYLAGRHVTLEKETAAALEQAQRQSAERQKMEALGQLTGGVAHDFNNLLMIVSGHSERLLQRFKDPRDRRALQAIQRASTRGESLTRQLLSFSRGQPLNPTVINPAETINAVRDVLAGSLHVNIKLSIEISEAIWPVRVDKSEIELALVNLVLNARDAMPEGGRLSIEADNVQLGRNGVRDGLMGDFVALRVIDTGCGIPPEHLAKVFDPFFTTKGAKGTGLGLSQVYGFARRSGGSVALASEPGRGTTVTLYLPRSRGAIEQPVNEDAGQFLAVGNETVLVVEDNDEVRTVAVSLLEQLGYRATAVESAPLALERLAAGATFDLIFTDVVMPGDIDGIALARTVRSRYPGIPIVLTTGYARIFDTEPEFPVLRKPYQLAALGRAMRDALDSAKVPPTVAVRR